VKELTLIVKETSKNELLSLRILLDNFVKEHFDLLYLGACRLEVNIEADDFAPRRVQFYDTRLHKEEGLKVAAGHYHKADRGPTENQIKGAVDDLQALLNAAAEPVKAAFTIKIKKEEGEKILPVVVEQRTGRYKVKQVIIDHPKHGRLLLSQDVLTGGGGSWQHGKIVSLKKDDTFDTLVEPINLGKLLIDAALEGDRHDRPVTRWGNDYLKKLATVCKLDE
jgi:hypothetical protein